MCHAVPCALALRSSSKQQHTNYIRETFHRRIKPVALCFLWNFICKSDPRNVPLINIKEECARKLSQSLSFFIPYVNCAQPVNRSRNHHLSRSLGSKHNAKVTTNTHAHVVVVLTINTIQIPEIWRRHEMKYMNVRQVHEQTIFPVDLSKLLLHPQTVFLFFFRRQ